MTTWSIRRNSLLIILFIATVAATVFSENLFSDTDLKILESSERGVTLEITPQIDRIDSLRLQGEIYLKINMAHASFADTSAAAMIPIRSILVGVPLTGEIKANLVTVTSEEISGRLLPAPRIDRDGRYSFDPTAASYQVDGYYPPNIISVTAPAFVRDQRTVTIRLSGVQFSPQLKRIRIFKKIVVRIDFAGQPVAPDLKIPQRAEDEFYDGLIVNYATARHWLRPHAAMMQRGGRSHFQNQNWYKISIRKEGLYRLTGAFLSSVGANIESIPLTGIRLFNNGGRELPREVAVQRPDSLIENAIRVVDLDNNGKFNSADYILFYGKAVNNWEPLPNSLFSSHYINHYTNENVYWLTWDNSSSGMRMAEKASLSQPDLQPASHFWGLYYAEDEINNYLESGLHWFGRLVAGTSEQSYSAYLPHPANQDNNVYFRIQCLGLTSGNHRFSITLNNQPLLDFSFAGNRLEMRDVQQTITLSANGYNTLKVRYFGETAASQIYIDWFEIQYKKQFLADDNQLRFSQAGDNSTKFQLSNFSDSPVEVYDISNFADVQFFRNTEATGTGITFVEPNTSNSRREYLAVTPRAYLVPDKIEPDTFVDLRRSISGAEFIIITHDDFYSAVLPLAQHRAQHDSLQTAVIKISDIYREFSWGLFDPTAIRDFIKFAYDHWNPVPKYVLLCGDGDYDYKNIKGKLDKNWIPTFQTTELNENVNRTMDDWFVQVSGTDEQPDLAIGRFPVQSAEETQNVVEKIIRYETMPFLSSDATATLDDWRNVVTMVGDDEVAGADSDNETMHTNDAENIIENYIPNFFNKEKIYLIEYPAVKDPSTSGVMKPEATAALLDRIQKGTLILNYVGHGAPSLWAHERLLKENRDYERIENADRLPLWVAATCDFGRFDDPMEQSFSEKLFAARQRGGIAFLTSARLAYASDNTALNREFYNQLFIASEKPTARLGVALMRAKNRSYSTTNDQKYHLFGDPAMRLAAPRYDAQIISLQPDTLKALSEMKIKGQIKNQNSVWNEFQGKALLKVFDSAVDKVYLTKYNSPIRYRARGKTVFRGLLSVREGQFEGRFIIPKDITYGANMGRVSIYFADTQAQGTGFRNAIKVGGTSTLQDTEGPLIKIGVAGQNFVDGSLVNNNSILEIEIADSISGVNIAGDIGHHITMVVDEQEDQKIYLTDLFNYYEGNFKAGKVRYELSSFKRTTFDQNNVPTIEYGLPPGNHTITVKAWDNFNNSAVASAQFTLIAEDQLQLQQVLNFPNPFAGSTTFTFIVNHPSEVKIKIFTVSGRLIETMDHLIAEAGMNQFDWNGRDRQGDDLANGVYLYKVIATAQVEGKTLRDECIGKLVIMR